MDTVFVVTLDMVTNLCCSLLCVVMVVVGAAAYFWPNRNDRKPEE